TAEIHGYETTVSPQGSLPMQLLPETTDGNFFNQQHRSTATLQLIETLSGTHRTGTGLHMFKAGIDMLHSRFHGTSQSDPLSILRTDGTLARLIASPPTPTRQAENSTDVAMFAKARFQPMSRFYLELGGRLDRDGVIDRWNMTPRIGAAVLLN